MPNSAPLRDDPGLTLALAIVVTSTVPMLLLDADKRVVAASASFCTAFDVDCTVAGALLTELGEGEWGSRTLQSLIDATISGDAAIEAYEMDLQRAHRPPRHLAIKVQRLTAPDDPTQMRLLLSITDLTDLRRLEKSGLATRAKNEALERDNQLLLLEIRHRVANSLQIIASVMMQNARRTQSEETRSHLRDAHNRVMSVAELQQQLAVSTSGAVNIRSYLTKLCATIGASMIADPDRLRLRVDAQDVDVDPAVSVSLGLIVTELAINALKHAFPGEVEGTITVKYAAVGPAWTLSVTDDGKGMPQPHGPAMAGLGTSIVQALARQLRAQVTVEDARPGVSVSVIHALAGELDHDPDLTQPEPAI
ncbi:sensor histidine kinase [Caulobacter sp. 1776]|uniref:sensor histidine kinase n=1 Tax=Caulobacter sp. 1776 TaxID=3156420 RepID=UPI0033997203